MHLRRGLLRLWAVLAAIWIAAATWLFWDALTVTKHEFLLTTSYGRFEISGPAGATKEQALEHFIKELEASNIAKPGDRAALLAEAYKRGLLPPDMKAAYEEAQKRGLVPRPIRVQSADGVIHEFPPGTSMDTVDWVMKHYADSMKASNPQQWPGLPDIPQQTTKEQLTVTDEFAADWPRRRETAAVVLFPPLGVLVVGIGLFWAAQGFRSRKN